MADPPPERASTLRLFLDATILINAASFPRLPFEVVRLGLRGELEVILSPTVVASARLHVGRLYPRQLRLFEQVLERLGYTALAIPRSPAPPRSVSPYSAACVETRVTSRWSWRRLMRVSTIS